MATVILQDLSKVIAVPVGTAASFRGQINNNFTVLKNASQQLQNMVGEWDETEEGTIATRLFKNKKICCGNEAAYDSSVANGLILEDGDFWFLEQK